MSEKNYEIVANECDEWMLFGDTVPKREKNDHSFQNSYLEYIIAFCDSERADNDKPPIPSNIAHAHDCGDQCECHQNFLKIASHS